MKHTTNILEFPVNEKTHQCFRDKIEELGFEIHGVRPSIAGFVENRPVCVKGSMTYTIYADAEYEAILADYAFMTFIYNPQFQKYYKEHPAWREWADAKMTQVFTSEEIRRYWSGA